MPPGVFTSGLSPVRFAACAGERRRLYRNGSVGYTAETTQTSFLSTCGPSTAGLLASVSLPAQMLLTLPDGLSLLALSPPDVQSVTASITGPLTLRLIRRVAHLPGDF